jgi:G3E family GTPase
MAPRIMSLAFPVAKTSRRAFSRSGYASITRTSTRTRTSVDSCFKRCDSRLFLSTTSPADSQIGSKVPITLLSGFLGAGKTVTLQHLMENTEGIKIGVIVNDVASVNIDAKLVTGSKGGVVELQNGCACCSLADELLTSVEGLLADGRELDAVIVELSGVADPVAIQANWQAALMDGHPVTSKADISQVVTLVDSSTFGTDWMSWDVAGQRDGWVDPADDCAAQLKVPELLAEQIEAADVILVNKVDLAGPEQVQVASVLVKSLNDKAVMEEVEYGRLSPQQILRTIGKLPKEEVAPCREPDCCASSTACTEPECSDPSHSHSHDHDCSDSDCTDSSHSHDHDHASSCGDPDCTDPSHSDSHDPAASKTSTDQLGIVNFVYKRDRPFNVRKLMVLLNQWPIPIKENLDLSLIKDAQEGGYEVEGITQEASPFIGVLRSKGFCWFAPTKWTGRQDDVWRHDTAMYWSHAGKHFGISSAGKWWGTLSKELMNKYFQDNLKEYERIMNEDFVTDEFGDRRQEIVFIGIALNEEEITRSLDQCLLTEKGMGRYRQELANYMNRVLTSPTGGSGLFDVGAVDHLDVDN